MIGKPWHYKRCYGVIAITRSGLPEPLTILSGAAITIAPVGGSNSRFTRLVMPNLPAPCMYVWLGNGGAKPPPSPPSVPPGFPPPPKISRRFPRTAPPDAGKPAGTATPPAVFRTPPPPLTLILPAP